MKILVIFDYFFQHGVFLNMEASGMPTEFPFLSDNLRKIGYKNYLIGKWHLGMFKVELLVANPNLGYCKKEFLVNY